MSKRRKNTLVINLWAGPGTGKSTTASDVFRALKRKHVDCELINEFAKQLTLEENFTALDNQFYVSAMQQYKEYLVIGKFDVAITDSPLPLGIIYNKDKNQITRDALKLMVLGTFRERNNLNYFIRRTKPYNPNGRNQTEAEARLIDTEILTLLNEYDIKYETVTSSDDGLDKIINDILVAI